MLDQCREEWAMMAPILKWKCPLCAMASSLTLLAREHVMYGLRHLAKIILLTVVMVVFLHQLVVILLVVHREKRTVKHTSGLILSVLTLLFEQVSHMCSHLQIVLRQKVQPCSRYTGYIRRVVNFWPRRVIKLIVLPMVSTGLRSELYAVRDLRIVKCMPVR